MNLLAGRVSRFAIETDVSTYYPANPAMASGKFFLHVDGRRYGVDEPDATCLGGPLRHIQQRISRRGGHLVPFAKEMTAQEIALIFLDSIYGNGCVAKNLGHAVEQVRRVISSRNIDWSSDVDEAFDDGSHVYQFDLGERVRLVACRNREVMDISEVVLPADVFYGILDRWQKSFTKECDDVR